LARSVIGERGIIQVTTPGIRPAELGELGELCNVVVFNSMSQLSRLGFQINGPDQVGLRVNPCLSVVDDLRYDPCRPHSKLGVPVDQLLRQWKRQPEVFDGVGGLHFHTNCDASGFEPLYRTVLHLEQQLGNQLSCLKWINLGGGYLFDSAVSSDPLTEAVYLLRSRYGLDVYIEPGAALVRKAGYLVTTVIDLFRSAGKSIAVLDTTINHVPEVFEYQFEPDILGHDDNAAHEYQLVGSSCLAGDLMGKYAFHQPLRIGSRIVLANVGAYSLVKAHMFNGINLPAIYSVTPAGELILRKRFTYEDFLFRCGACCDAAV
jgi:carboxynorspermidine decarboxylase